MKDWKTYNFSDFVNLNPSIRLEKGYNYSFVEMKDLVNGQRYCEPSQIRKLSGGTRFQNGDTLFARITPCLENGKICQVRNLKNDVGFGSTEFHVFRGKDGVSDTDFVFYLSRWDEVRNHAEINLHGTSGRQRVPKEAFYDLELLLPPLPEQKAIAETLSSLDDKIGLLHRQNKTLEQMAETLFRQWFVEEAKEDWELVKIGMFVKTNNNSANKDYPHQIIKYLDTGSLTEGKIETLQEFSFNEAPSRARRLVKHNDVLISTVRPNQKHYGIIKNPIDNLVVSTGFCVITCENIDPHFIYILLTNSDMTEYLHSIAEGSTSTYPSLKPSDIEAVEFQLPPNDLLTEFANYCNNAWGKIDKNQNQIRTLEQMRDTLLPKLMSGEVTIN